MARYGCLALCKNFGEGFLPSPIIIDFYATIDRTHPYIIVDLGGKG